MSKENKSSVRKAIDNAKDLSKNNNQDEKSKTIESDESDEDIDNNEIEDQDDHSSDDSDTDKSNNDTIRTRIDKIATLAQTEREEFNREMASDESKIPYIIGFFIFIFVTYFTWQIRASAIVPQDEAEQ